MRRSRRQSSGFVSGITQRSHQEPWQMPSAIPPPYSSARGSESNGQSAAFGRVMARRIPLACYPLLHCLQMRILDRRMAKRARSTRGCLGYALLTGRFDSVAAVFFHRAVDLESGNVVSQSSVLGAMMAHEIGHLLLDQGHHPDAGILRASWSKEDLRAIARSQLYFTDAEGQLMRSMVAQRERSVSEIKSSLIEKK